MSPDQGKYPYTAANGLGPRSRRRRDALMLSRGKQLLGGSARVDPPPLVLPPTPEPGAVSIAEAARRAGVSRSKLYQALPDDLPSLKVGRRRLVRLGALRAWLAGLE